MKRQRVATGADKGNSSSTSAATNYVAVNNPTLATLPPRTLSALDISLQKPDAEAEAEELAENEVEEDMEEESQQGKERGCRCGRTKCLKQYCQCFRNDIRCTSDCVCSDCHNDGKHEEKRIEAIRHIRMNNPSAFKGTALELEDQEVTTPKGGKKTVRGCRCKRSKCQKKYCECFSAGIPCTSNCVCTDCANGNTFDAVKDVSVIMKHKKESNKDAEKAQVTKPPLPTARAAPLAAGTPGGSVKASTAAAAAKEGSKTEEGSVTEKEKREQQPKTKSFKRADIHIDVPVPSHARVPAFNDAVKAEDVEVLDATNNFSAPADVPLQSGRDSGLPQSGRDLTGSVFVPYISPRTGYSPRILRETSATWDPNEIPLSAASREESASSTGMFLSPQGRSRSGLSIWDSPGQMVRRSGRLLGSTGSTSIFSRNTPPVSPVVTESFWGSGLVDPSQDPEAILAEPQSGRSWVKHMPPSNAWK